MNAGLALSLLSIIGQLVATSCVDFRIGVLLPALNGPDAELANGFQNLFQMELSRLSPTSNDVTFSLEFRDVTEKTIVPAVLDLMGTARAVIAVLGAYTSDESRMAQYVLQHYEKPQISFTSTAAQLSDRMQFPFFLRTTPSDTQQADAISRLCLHFGFVSISLLVAESPFGLAIGAQFRPAARSVSLDIVFEYTFVSMLRVGANAQAVNATIAAALLGVERSPSNVVVVLCDGADAPMLLSLARHGGFISRGWAWISTTSVGMLPASTEMDGIIALTPRGWKSATTTQFQDLRVAWRAAYPTKAMPLYAAQLVDALELLTRAVSSLRARSRNVTDGRTLLQELVSTSFDGAGGRVAFDGNSNSAVNYDIVNFKRNDQRIVVGVVQRDSVLISSAIEWPGASLDAPLLNEFRPPPALRLGIVADPASVEAAVALASADLVNNDVALLPSSHVELVVRPIDSVTSGGCGFGGGANAAALVQAADAIESSLVAVVGHQTNDLSSTIASVARARGVPQISPGATSSLFSEADAQSGNGFVRLVGDVAFEGLELADVVLSYGWRQVALVSSADYFAAAENFRAKIGSEALLPVDRTLSN